VIFQAAPGTMEFTKKWNPRVGDIVTFKHRGFMLGSKKPKWPTLSHLRPEMTWEDVVSNFVEKKPRKRGSGIHLPARASVPLGYWKKRENRRNHLCEFATKMGFNPLVSDNWEKLNRPQLVRLVSGMVSRFKGSYKMAIVDAFPELQFSKEWLQNLRNAKQSSRSPNIRGTGSLND